MSGLRTPRFLSNIYRDLRDRHLLLPALALVVALVAVPVLLSEPEPAPVPAPAPTGGNSSAVTPAVLADNSVDVRNYSKRLDELKTKNPFKQQFTGAPAGTSTGDGSTTAAASGGTTGTDTASGSAVSASSGSTETTDTSTTSVDTTVESDSGGSASNDDQGDDRPHKPSQSDVETVTQLYTYRIDLTIGLQGDPKLHENVKPMTVLPNESTPVVAFLGTDEQGKRAAFVVSSQATPVEGDFSCVPSPENCLYVTMQKKDSMTLEYGTDGQVFELKLLGIQDVEL